MTTLYLSFKDQVRSIINRNFPANLAKRFTFRADSEIYIPSMDEGVWGRKRRGTESMHILFDMLEIFEIPYNIHPKKAEVLFLIGFKEAIKRGDISVTKKIEWTDNATAKRNKRDLKAKKAKKVEQAIKAARDIVRSRGTAFHTIERDLPIGGKRKIVKL